MRERHEFTWLMEFGVSPMEMARASVSEFYRMCDYAAAIEKRRA